jgi:hypothetical protein
VEDEPAYAAVKRNASGSRPRELFEDLILVRALMRVCARVCVYVCVRACVCVCVCIGVHDTVVGVWRLCVVDSKRALVVPSHLSHPGHRCPSHHVARSRVTSHVTHFNRSSRRSTTRCGRC